MGFILKKIIATFVMPLPLGIIFGLIGLFYLSKSKTIKRGKRWITFSFLWLFLFSYAPVSHILLFQIEKQYPTLHQVPKNVQYIYVLGNGHTTDETLPITSQLNNEAVVRLNEGIRLYHQTEGRAKLILSGYSGLFDPTPHALMQQKLALALGVPKKDIIVCPEPKDTEDEALAAKKIIAEKPFILVTSAYHMPRAFQWFKKENLHPIPAPTYHLASLKQQNYLDIFSIAALVRSTIAFHEYLGILWQTIKYLNTKYYSSLS